ncbi:tetratricopeptide repeat protein [Hyalangium versicolor]|uniref:tetratricopeptide repeat protein n=1 Tax=Hyalangium versicolor TaxID=2861190 RepID=UPI001CCE9E9C|nr:tetratricopeptide repeat protein [Hyalangium versicolor]
MTLEARAEMQARAERALRRGELAEAVGLYETLVQQFPHDEALAQKLALLRESLQPMELQSPKARPPARDEPLHQGPSSPVQEGERLFALGDYAAAAAAYRRALQDHPHNELIQERLVELYRLATSAPRYSPTDKALPKEPEDRLQALLDRLAARRRLKRD